MMDSYLTYFPTGSDSAVYIHYTSAGIPDGETVTDASGEPLGDVGAAWVVDAGDDAFSYAVGEFPEMASPLGIPCPHSTGG